MAINLKLTEKSLADIEDVKLHYMPCKINGDEDANVSKYFEPYIRKTEDNCFEASFRGHPLKGQIISVPEGYKGIMVSEHKKPDTETEKRNLFVTGKFSTFTYWNYDKVPSDSDAITKALDWVDIAKALHSPVSGDEEETEAEITIE